MVYSNGIVTQYVVVGQKLMLLLSLLMLWLFLNFPPKLTTVGAMSCHILFPFL